MLMSVAPGIHTATLVSEGHTAMEAMPVWVACTASWGHDNHMDWIAV